MFQAGGGSIINISSTASINPTPNTAFYGGAKAALGVISQAVAAAYHPKVRVNTIIVGPFATDVAQHWPDPPDPADPRRTRSGMRIGAPEDIVSTALYLSADASRYVNGASIKVDGGGWGMGRARSDADAVS
jgi:NAD(P)-dependent dehydrogenase (short-subunit alcohol dehydrogenase family)